MSMWRLTNASVHVLVVAQLLHLCSAFTTTTAHLRKHVNSAVVAPAARYPSATNPASRAPWASGGGTASVGWGCGLETELDDGRLIKSRAAKSQRLLSMMAASPPRAETVIPAPPAIDSSATRSVNWPLWYVLPIAPYQSRKTLMKEIVPGKVRGGRRVNKRLLLVRAVIFGTFQTSADLVMFGL